MTSDPQDPDAPPSEEELVESARLREALEDASKASPDADLLRAVKSAAAPDRLDSKALDDAIAKSLAARPRTRGRVVWVAFGGVALAAAAAVVLLLVGGMPPREPSLATARSTQSLFVERFESRGGESARIDRIAMARGSDLRENHYARWGARR
jgi:hypothetical protein